MPMKLISQAIWFGKIPLNNGFILLKAVTNQNNQARLLRELSIRNLETNAQPQNG
jgi:hypothetical protein